MINHVWSCKKVDAYPQKDGVVNLIHRLHFTVEAVSDQLDGDVPFSSTYIGSQELVTDDVTNFVSFENLTNEILI